MSHFEERWKECVRVARLAPGRGDPPPPLVAAIQARRNRSPEEDPSDVETAAWWRWYGTRGVAVASLVAVVCVVFALQGMKERDPFRPGVEDAVAEVFFLL